MEYSIAVFLYINPGFEREFMEYESMVLPLLDKYSGKVNLRFRPEKDSSSVSGENGLPFEVHILSFPAKADLEAYKNDPDRIKYQYLAEISINRTEIFEHINNK